MLSLPRRRGGGFTFEVQQMVKEDLSGSFVVKAFSWDMIDFMGEHGDIFITKGRYISA
jgi:hypothetical protein